MPCPARTANTVGPVRTSLISPQVPTVAAALPPAFVPRVLTLLSEMLAASPHLEFMLNWVSVEPMEKCGPTGVWICRISMDTPRCGSTR